VVVALLITACETSTDVRSTGAATVPAFSTPPDTKVSSTTTAPPASDPTGTTDTTTSEAPSTSAPEPTVPNLSWRSCRSSLECATLEAPLDWSNPSAGTIKLPLIRTLATLPEQRIGSMLVNPGGPGFGGAYLVEGATGIFSQSILEHFDVVTWDPRGTGGSQPAVDCIDTYDEYFGLDVTPNDAAAQQALEDAAKKFDAACDQKNGSLLAHISTQDTARDMDLIRRALGEDKISYFGFSYGSELGSVWATMFPGTVRAAVLDGAADPNADAMQGAIDQASGFEIALNAFLEDCKGKCAFAQGGDPGAAFDKILADIDANAYPTDQGRPPLNSGIAYSGVIDALYSQSLWLELDDALNQARQGNGSGLLALYDDYYQRRGDGSYGNELEAFLAISCLDDRGPATVADVDSYNAQIEAVAPRIAPGFEHGYSCVYWPVPSVAPLLVTGKGAGTIVVIGTTNDPATPYTSSLNMAKTLEGGRFIKVVGNGHTGYSKSPCAQDLVDKYLIDLQAPPPDATCD
jgi:pimeloyl-ACP methyl ester carboxylesterase